MRNARHAKALWLFAGVAVLLAGGVSYFACSKPDALEYSVEKYATGGTNPAVSQQSASDVPLSQQGISPLEKRPVISGGIAGLAGIVVTFFVVAGVGLLLTRGRGNREAKSNG